MFMDRRHFLRTTLATAALPSLVPAQDAKAKKRILLRSSWQTVNIGDIAHTPGMLHLLEKHLPEYDVTLWPSSVENGVAEMLTKRFPKLKILTPTAEAKKTAFETHDFLLHGSGPGIVGQKSLVEWAEKTGKPYGIGGVTWNGGKDNGEAIKVISGGKFAFFRDSVSLELAKSKGATCPIMEFGPDATFACDLVNDEPATAWLQEVGLEDGKFVCCIPKLRNTPYWEIKKGVKFDEKKNARNEEMKEHDIAPLRNAVIAVVQQTPMKVLLCPEDASQMKLNKEMIYDKLPEDVKKKVVWRQDYWLTDFAQSVYNRSAGLFGNEQHSPIMCIGHGIPAIVCRYKEQTSKGFMWKDIGLSEWLFDHDFDEAEKGLTPAVLAIVNDPAAAKAKALKGKAVADDRMKRMMDVLRASLEA
ncbi:polysaccharide pyruvyl transferase family protein [Verrucomicrobium spinosum]|uniref:polysaccharide pyruvyl transferase family protein n=1 Tax=Verrucomicrobium spinosum TaxID=2736 RepID=UPI000174500C